MRIRIRLKNCSYYLVVSLLLLLYCSPLTLGSLKLKHQLQYCEKSTPRCTDMNNSVCLGVKLPYTSTSSDLVLDADTPEEAQVRLDSWLGLKKVPKCWTALQPLLCALYLPNCINNSLHLPPQELCKRIENNCQILKIENSWPVEFNCENETLYPSKFCKNDLLELKFNSTSGQCESPLVQTFRHTDSHYPFFEGCDLQCNNPLFSEDEHKQVHRLIAWIATICILCNIFTILTFIIEWQSLNRYPNIVILYINICFLIICLGWLSQFLPNARNDIVCRKNGARKTYEPSDGEDLLCAANFFFLYYFFIAAFVWFDIFAYALYTTFESFGKIQKKVDKKGGCFHLSAWSIPVLLYVGALTVGEIDGDSVTGTCFVGINNKIYGILFVLLPVLISVMIGLFYLVRVLIGLLALKKECTQVISEQAKSKIHSAAVKVTVFMILIVILVSSMSLCFIYEYINDQIWNESLRKYIVCKLDIISETSVENCQIEFRPSVSKKQLYVLVLFGNGILMSFWVWTYKIGLAWCEYLIHWFKKWQGNELSNQPKIEPTKYNKHKLIASAFAKRHKLNSDDFTITFSKEDPFGLVFGLNSNITDNISSTWANALPKFVRRRGALTGKEREPLTGKEHGPLTCEEHVSVSSSSFIRSDSEISISMCRVSVASRSHSLDSTISIQAFEMTRKVRRFSKHVKKKQKLRNKSVGHLPLSQKGSVTSQDINGQFMLTFPDQNMVQLPNEILNNVPVPSFDRRTATADFDNDLENRLNNVSISSLNLFNNRMFHMSLGRLCNSDQSEQIMLEDLKKLSSNRVYKAIAIVDTDTDNGEKSSDSYDTD